MPVISLLTHTETLTQSNTTQLTKRRLCVLNTLCSHISTPCCSREGWVREICRKI